MGWVRNGWDGVRWEVNASRGHAVMDHHMLVGETGWEVPVWVGSLALVMGWENRTRNSQR